MENSKLKRVIALALSVMMVFGIFVMANPNALIAASAVEEDEKSATEEALEILGDAKWLDYKAKTRSIRITKAKTS